MKAQSKIVKHHYIGIVTNACDALLQLKFKNGFSFMKRKKSKVIDLIHDHTVQETHDIEFDLDYLNAYDRSKKNVFTLEKQFEFENIKTPKHQFPWIAHNAKVEREAEEIINKLRLFEEGGIEIRQMYINSVEEEGEVAESSSRGDAFTVESPYQIHVSDIPELQSFIETHSFPLKHQYMQISFEYLNNSYRENQNAFNFISLMIAAEVLLNDGNQELRNRLSRNLSLLLSKNRDDFRRHFRQIKKVYDMRSILVHTGKSEITHINVARMRILLREAIKRAINLNLEKQVLVERLNEYGFRSALPTPQNIRV